MEFKQARQNMIDGQLRPNKINNNALLKRFMDVPRELFVDPAHKHTAYIDSPLMIEEKRDMFSPIVCARLLQELDIQPDDKVLIVASGTGYTAALVHGLTPYIVAVEDNKFLTNQARNALLDCGIENIKFVTDSPENGYDKGAPYDKVILNAPADYVPKVLLNQTKPNGKIAVVKKGENGVLETTILTKHGQTLFENVLFETKGTILPNFAAEENFVF